MAWGGLSLFVPLFRYAMKCLDKKRIKMKQGETLALNERIMLSLVSTGVSALSSGQVAAQGEMGGGISPTVADPQWTCVDIPRALVEKLQPLWSSWQENA